MQCPDFYERLQVCLDERRLPEHDPALAEHAAACGKCAEILAAQGAIEAAMVNLPAPRLRPDFAAQVVQQALAATPAAAMSSMPARGAALRHSLRRAWLAVALTAAAAAGIIWFSPGWEVKPDGGTKAEAKAHRAEKGATLAAIDSRPKNAAKAETPLQPMQAENVVASGTTAPDMISPPIPMAESAHESLLSETQIREWVQSLPDAVERIEEVDYLAVEDYAPGLRSIRTSLSLALETLRKSLPGHREAPKSEGALWMPLAAPTA